MTAPQHRVDPGLDELRRRLYRPGASEADLRQYLEEQQALRAEAAPAAPVPRPPARRRLPIDMAVGAAAAVAVAAVALAASLPRAADGPARPTPVAGVFVDVGDGQQLVVDASLVRGPALAATSIDGVAIAGQRFDGVGNAVLVVDLPPAGTAVAHAALAITSTRESTVGWRALRVAARTDWSSYQQVVARGALPTRPGIATEATFTYSHSAPARIAVEASADVGWTLTIGATTDPAAALR